MATPRSAVLTKASNLIDNDRNHAYGPPINNMSAGKHFIDALMIGIACYSTRKITDAEAHALQMAMMKLARIVSGPQVKEDHYVDLAGYIAIAYECAADGVSDGAEVSSGDVPGEGGEWSPPPEC